MDIQARLTRKIRRGHVVPVKIKPERVEKYMHSQARKMARLREALSKRQ